MHYHAEGGELLIFQEDDKLLWKGRPESYEVLQASSLPNTEDGIVCFNYLQQARFGRHKPIPVSNLVRLKPDCSIIWRAELPYPDDRYVEFRFDGEQLVAFSYGCFRMKLDLSNGKIVEKVFTK